MALDNKKQKRHIIVDGQSYVWKFNQHARYLRNTFRAYATDTRTSFLSIHFHDLSCSSAVPYIVGHPEAGDVNLYTPIWAATLIRYGLANGWDPHVLKQGLIIEDGVGVLKALAFKPLQNLTKP